MLVLSRLGLVNDPLATFPPDVLKHLEQHLQSVELNAGQTLYETGGHLRYAYFPITAVISLFSSLREGVGTEIAVVGREGIVGVGTFMGTGTAVSSAVVLRTGHAMCLEARHVEELTKDARVVSNLLQYSQTLFINMAQTAACCAHHSLYQQLCSWLLQHLDCQKEDDLCITQEQIAGMLGVRRESVTAAAMKLQRDAAIKYQRGHIQVINRQMLEHEACECYSVISGSLANLRLKQCASRALAAEPDRWLS
jgi:CRP-like cAMP-binding protein